jgi:hypothetical protein
MKPFMRLGGLLVIAAALAACSGNQGVVPASLSSSFSQNSATRGALNVAREKAAYQVSNFSYHIFPVIGKRPVMPAPNTTVIHPADLHYFGGSVMKTAVWHNIYVNCKTNSQKCWGNPEGFETALTSSTLIKLLTQYTKAAAGAYTFGEGTPVSYPVFSNIFYDNDLFSILHAVAKSIGSVGYGNEYHIFLPKGIDTCFDGTTICYSPDIPANWIFCAYHGNVTFSDIGTVVFSVEPYQNVRGCVSPSLPKGFDPLTNTTNSVLAHETFESITDANPNSFQTLGWYNLFFNGEIGDLCAGYPVVMPFGNSKYYIQTMYSNKYHGCANGP